MDGGGAGRRAARAAGAHRLGQVRHRRRADLPRRGRPPLGAARLHVQQGGPRPPEMGLCRDHAPRRRSAGPDARRVAPRADPLVVVAAAATAAPVPLRRARGDDPGDGRGGPAPLAGGAPLRRGRGRPGARAVVFLADGAGPGLAGHAGRVAGRLPGRDLLGGHALSRRALAQARGRRGRGLRPGPGLQGPRAAGAADPGRGGRDRGETPGHPPPLALGPGLLGHRVLHAVVALRPDGGLGGDARRDACGQPGSAAVPAVDRRHPPADGPGRQGPPRLPLRPGAHGRLVVVLPGGDRSQDDDRRADPRRCPGWPPGSSVRPHAGSWP